ncbi:hypothetical protein RRG08_001950 [Elysia crispata]|uniref:Uncharacterized protein n=1 Tax=Elysia crispata TaxID=231223 RepID=A0AAE1BAQ2_9GAST|nr:hypothetical protein RRG08_001950 [Elysia crispata]
MSLPYTTSYNSHADLSGKETDRPVQSRSRQGSPPDQWTVAANHLLVLSDITSRSLRLGPVRPAQRASQVGYELRGGVAPSPPKL